MFSALNRIVPPEPPEKWEAIRAAIEDDDKTRRLCRIMLTNNIPVVLAAIAVLVLIVITG